MPGFGPRLKKVMEGVKNTIDRESRKKAAKEAAMEAEKVKGQVVFSFTHSTSTQGKIISGE